MYCRWHKHLYLAGFVGFWRYKDCVILCYALGLNWRESTFVWNLPDLLLYCIMPQQHCLEYGQKMLPGPGNWSTTTKLHKVYHTQNTPDEGGSTEKSQECRINIHILPKGSWPLLWYLYGWIISAVHTKWDNTSKQKWKINWRKKAYL